MVAVGILGKLAGRVLVVDYDFVRPVFAPEVAERGPSRDLARVDRVAGYHFQLGWCANME